VLTNYPNTLTSDGECLRWNAVPAGMRESTNTLVDGGVRATAYFIHLMSLSAFAAHMQSQ